jgi:fucose permease
MYANPTVLAAAISGSFVFGLALALLGGLKVLLAKHLRLTERRAASLFAVVNTALIPMVLLGGVLLDRCGERVLLLGGPVALALGLVLLGPGSSEGRALWAVLLAALGASVLGTAALVLAPRAFFGPAEAVASVALASVFTTLGALLAPAALDVLGRSLGMPRTLAVLALVCLLPAFPSALAPSGALDVSRQPADLASLVEHGRIWLAALVLFFYIPLEGTVGLWTTTYLGGWSVSEKGSAGWLLSGYWTAFLVSRAALAAGQHAGLLPATWNAALLVLPPLLAAVLLGNVSSAADPRGGRAGLLLLGVLLGPVYPILVGLVLQDFPREPGTAYGVLYAAGSLGALLWSPLFGARDVGRSPRAALRLPMLLSLAVTASALVFVLTTE